MECVINQDTVINLLDYHILHPVLKEKKKILYEFMRD